MVSDAYSDLAAVFGSHAILRMSICLMVLLPPTILMGATLPAIARWTRTNQKGVEILAGLYAANLFGAVLGALTAGFTLLPNFDVYIASAVAVSVNVAIAFASFLMARKRTHKIDELQKERSLVGSLPAAHVLVAVTLSGFTALGAQVIWTRHLSTLIGATTYAFSAILVVFLTGLGIGSYLAAVLIRRKYSSGYMLAVCQLLLAPAMLIGSYFVMGRENPSYDIYENIDRTITHLFPLLAMLPATILWGASFPLAISIVRSRANESQFVGTLYALNTMGAIIAVALVVLWLVPTRGTQIVQQVLIVLSITSFLVVWVGDNGSQLNFSKHATAGKGLRLSSLAMGIMLTLAAIGSAFFVPAIDPGLIAYGRETHRWHGEHEYLYWAEGRSASVAISRQIESNDLRFHIGGKVVASTTVEDMRLQRLLGHLPALVHPRPKSVLIVGLGAGVTAGTFVRHEEVERIVIVEIEPEVSKAADLFFSKENNSVLTDPRTEIVFDDARHYLATTPEKFDVITADPVHPWVKGAATLYTREFFELCRSRLNPDGLITQWVPLYESNEDAVKSQVGTFLDVFSDGTVWNSQPDGVGYDLVLFGGQRPIRIQSETIDGQLRNYPMLAESLSAVGLNSAQDILKSYAGDRRSMESWLNEFEMNLDRNLRLEYLAGEALNQRSEQDIFSDIVEDFSYPGELFDLVDSEEQVLRDEFIESYSVVNQ